MASVHIEVANLVEGTVPRIEIHAQWLNEEQNLLLTDDGTVSWDIAHDQVWVGELKGEPIRVLPVRVGLAMNGALTEEVWASLEAIESEEDEVVFELVQRDGRPHLARVAAPFLGQARPDHERTRVVVLGFWALVVYGILALQVLRWRH